MIRRIALALLAACAPLIAAGAARADRITLVDVASRNVTLDVPARRIVLGFYFEDFMAVGGQPAMARVVGLSKTAWKGWRPANWEAHLKVDPTLDQIADIGEVENNTFSLEKLLSTRPDLVLLARWQADGIGADLQRIEAAGIPVVVVDFHDQSPEVHAASVRLFGAVTGERQRADEIAATYLRAIADIEARLAAAGRRPPTIYVELGNRGPGEHGPSYGDYMWGRIARIAGGQNVTRDLVKTWGPVTREQVLAANPEVIVVSGSEWRHHPTGQLMGQGVTAEEARARLKGFLTRPGWSELQAVRNRRVHAVYHGNSRTITDFTSAQYLAKVLYPDLFGDIDPQGNYLAFYRRYLSIVPDGTFMVQID